MATQFNFPRQVKINVAGRPYAGAQAFFYQTNTETPQQVYQDTGLTVPHAQPVIADDDGYFPVVWLDPNLDFDYRVRILSATGSLLDDLPDVPAKLVTSAQIIHDVTTNLDSLKHTQAEIDAGVTPVNYAYPPGNILRYGAVGDGLVANASVNKSAIQAAVNSLPANGGVISIPIGDYAFDGTIDLADRRSIIIRGEGKPTAGAAGASLLRSTQTSGSRVFDCRSTYGVVFEGLYILQQGAGFAGHVIDYEHSSAAADSAFGGIDDCYVQGASTALSLVNLHEAISMSITGRSHFVGGICALLGGGTSYANRINIIDCEFKQQVTAPIKNPGTGAQVWKVSGNTFEPTASGAAAAIFSDGRVTNLEFTANWLGDANATGSWIKVAAMDASSICVNLFSTGAKAIEVTGALSNSANVISANAFSSLTTALDISAVTGGASAWVGVYEPNFYQSVTNAILGTPTGGRYQAGNNADMQHKNAQILANAANGIGGTLSGVLWTILANLSVGQVVKAAVGQSADLSQWRDSADNVLLAVGYTGLLNFKTQADPSAPAAGHGYLFMRDNGSGKMQTCARYPSGAVQVISTEP